MAPPETTYNKQCYQSESDGLAAMGTWMETPLLEQQTLHGTENGALWIDAWSLLQARAALLRVSDTDLEVHERFMLKGYERPVTEKLYDVSRG